MPEQGTQEIVQKIPSFIKGEIVTKTLPAEPPPEAKPVAEAATTPPETPELPKVEPGKETTEKEPEPERQASRRYERRIDRATKRYHEAETRAQQLERQLAEARAARTPIPDSEKPDPTKYTDFAKYEEDMTAWASKKALKEAESKQKEEQSRRFTESVTSQWDSQSAKGEVEFEDWDEVVGELKPTAPWSVAIMQEENGYKIAHYLGKHPAEAKKLIALDPYAQVREIAKLSVKLQAPPAPPVKPSKAPAPITPVTGSAAPNNGEYVQGMSPEEYAKIRPKLFPRPR